MNSKFKYYLSDILFSEQGASEKAIENLLKQIDFQLPKEYIDLMREHNGGEGEMGEYGWLCLFPIEDLPDVNNSYGGLMTYIPDYYLIGKDAADTGFAFHKIYGTFHEFGLMSNFETDPIIYCGKDFSEFLEYLYNQKL